MEYLELNFSNLIVKAVSQNLRTQKKMNVMNELWVTVSISLFLFWQKNILCRWESNQRHFYYFNLLLEASLSLFLSFCVQSTVNKCSVMAAYDFIGNQVHPRQTSNTLGLHLLCWYLLCVPVSNISWVKFLLAVGVEMC